MADLNIGDLTAATTIVNADVLEIEQSGEADSRKVSIQQIRNFVANSLGSAASLNITVSATAPGSPVVGDLWLDIS